MTHEEICTYEVCKLAKEKGFNVQTFDWYDYTGNYHKRFIPHELHECPRYKEYYAPSQSLLRRWLREKKGLHITAPFDNNEFWWQIKNLANGDSEYGEALGFDTYELALDDALKYAFEKLV
jgi:hypothetical protein